MSQNGDRRKLDYSDLGIKTFTYVDYDVGLGLDFDSPPVPDIDINWVLFERSGRWREGGGVPQLVP